MKLLRELPSHANPCPTPMQCLRGDHHKNTRTERANQLWEPVRAIASGKHDCLKQLEGLLRERDGEAGRGLRHTGGVKALTRAGWDRLYWEVGISKEH